MIQVKIESPKGDTTFILSANEHGTEYTEENVVNLIDQCVTNEESAVVVKDVFGETVMIPLAMIYDSTAINIRQIPAGG